MGDVEEPGIIEKSSSKPLWFELAKWVIPAVVLPGIVWALSVYGTAINKQRDISDNNKSISTLKGEMAKANEELAKVRDSFDSHVSKIRDELKRRDERDNVNRREVEKALSDLRVLLAEVRGQYTSMEGSLDDLLDVLRDRRRDR